MPVEYYNSLGAQTSHQGGHALMGWQMYVAIPLFIVALLAAIFAALTHSRDDRELFGGTAILAFIASVIWFVFACTTIVGTRQIAIETRFGKPNGTSLSNGWHWKSPMTQTHEIDGAIQ